MVKRFTSYTGLISRAQSVLRENNVGVFTRPGRHQHPHQWNLDSAVVSLGLSHFDLPRALTEIRTLLGGQWGDGMMPHVLYHFIPSSCFPDAAFWETESSAHASTVPTSGITQPPLLTSVIRTLHRRTPVRQFVREVFPALLCWHRWLHTARDADGSGLVCIVHPWESGMADSPRWSTAMAAVAPEAMPARHAGGGTGLAFAGPPSRSDRDPLVFLVDVLRRHRYDPDALLAHSPFLVQDVLFNSILYRADEDLLALAIEAREPTGEIEGWLTRTHAGFNARFWDEARGLYLDYDVRAGKPIPANTAAAFAPLYAGLAGPEQVSRLMQEHWLNLDEYAPNRPMHFSLTTLSKTEPGWEGCRCWHGPVSILLNWLLANGWLRYGYDSLADVLQRDSVELMAGAGFRSSYDARDGSGCSAPDFSRSAALALEFMADVSIPR